MDGMGNVLCSMDSSIDFPPLNPQIHIRNKFHILGQWEDKDRTERPLVESYSSNDSSGISLVRSGYPPWVAGAALVDEILREAGSRLKRQFVWLG